MSDILNLSDQGT